MYRLTSLLLAGSIVLFGSVGGASCVFPARNFIYVVPDGYGQASQTLARDFESIVSGESTVERPNSSKLGVDTMVIGSVRTQASDDLVTDSAASATAFACGVKTYNGAIAVDDDGSPVGSILEAAHLGGFKTGLIATSRITHATPACYSSHVLSRGSENEIAAQQIGYSHPFGGPFVDVLMGGGRRHYLPKAAGGRRTDDVNLIEWAKEQGYTYAEDKPDFEDATTDGKLSLPFLGLFSSSHMSYELDRDVEKQASLLEMTKTAVESLQHASKDSEHGYFIMIEASRIDHAGHANDAAGHIHDTLMYNEVMAYLKEHVSANPDTQLLSAADHECGGLTLPDGWDPRPLAEPQSTTEHLTELFASYKGPDAKGYLKSDILPQYGLGDLSDDKVAALLVTYKNQGSGAFQTALGHASADKAGINWSTGKHSSVDVVLYGHAVGKAVAGMKKLIGGYRDNTELPLYLEKVLGVSLANATAKLQENGKDWIQKREDLSIIKHEALVAAKMHAHGDM